MTGDTEKPILVVVAFDIPGHTMGLVRVSEHLIRKGYKVYFITGRNMKRVVEKTGAVIVENPFHPQDLLKERPAKELRDDIWAALKYAMGACTIPAHRTLKETLERVRREHPEHEVIIIHEALASAIGPFLCGAPLPEGYPTLPKVITFHTTVYMTADGRTPPFGSGLTYDPTPANSAVWRSVADTLAPKVADLTDYYNAIYKSLGSTRPIPRRLPDAFMHFGDVTVFPMSPSLEYPPIIQRPGLRFIGSLPPAPVADHGFEYPTWWPTITANAALPADSPHKKKVVFVSQGTIHRDPHELLLPTLHALADREDLIVVATLGSCGAKLADIIPPPPPPPQQQQQQPLPTTNAFVANYIPYDAILPHADVFVSNAGFGGLAHGIMHGVPLVLALGGDGGGGQADKAEVCARAERAGVAVCLRGGGGSGSGGPDAGALRAAVDRVLREPRYREKARELCRENWDLDALGQIEDVIQELARGGGEEGEGKGEKTGDEAMTSCHLQANKATPAESMASRLDVREDE